MNIEIPTETNQKERWFERLKRNQLGRRLFIGFVFLTALSIFLHYREIQMEVLELNTIAPRYIIGQVDFEFPDEEATLMMKRESLRDVGVIAGVIQEEVARLRLAFETRIVEDQNWRQSLPHTTFEELYRAAHALEDTLCQSRFTDGRTLQKIKDLGLSSTNTFLFVPFDSPAVLPFEVWERLKTKLADSYHFQPETLDYILAHFENQPLSLHEDPAAGRLVRHFIQENMLDVMTKVEAGTRIIGAGEFVSSRHMAMMSAMKEALKKSYNRWGFLSILGDILLAAIFTVLAAIYFKIKHRDISKSLQKLTLLVTIVILALLFAKGTEYILINKAHYLVEEVRYPLFVPFASVLVCVLVCSEAALFASVFLAVLLGASLAVDHSRFLVINLIGGLVAIISARSMHKRMEVFGVLGKVWLSCIPVIIAFNLVEDKFWHLNLINDLLSTFAFMGFSAIVIVGLLPILESLFHVMTDMTLMEYMDPNNELLRRLSLEAPGTYQHCLVVGNLAETAARSIGANGLFCRVSTLYHDIGKLFNPHYFTENQLGGFNIHQLLTPQESAQVIIAHVTEGEALARKYRLPQSFIDIIREHHATTLVYCFYHKQLELMGGDVNKIDERRFRYPGPKPHTKESAIIMLADTVEAASRSVEDATEEAVAELVERLVHEKEKEGLLDDCQLSFEELKTVKKTMIKTLIVARHLRVKYPEKTGELVLT